MKIISFHFAGGNRYSLNKLFNNSNSTRIINFELTRNFPSFCQVIENFVAQIKECGQNSEFFIYGHSMGALIGFLVCQKLQTDGLPMPQKLIVSGKKAPSIPREEKIAHLPDNEFWEEIIVLGGIPNEMQKYPELIDYYLPILRYDFRLVESYQYKKKPKLNIPIDVFYGSEEVMEEEVLGWEVETTEKVTFTKLSGNHFFIFNHVEYFRNYFDKLINKK